jgi:hypothetical protein
MRLNLWLTFGRNVQNGDCRRNGDELHMTVDAPSQQKLVDVMRGTVFTIVG